MKSNEIWKDIPGYEGLYQVSNLGNIKSLLFNKNILLKQRKHPSGYMLVNLKRKTFRVHNLVAQAFINNPHNYREINHKDENKQNNCVDNLEWCDRKYNCNYGALPKQVGKRFSKPVITFDFMNNRIFYQSAMEAERKTGIDHSSIIKCCKHKIKTAGGKVWRYENEI